MKDNDSPIMWFIILFTPIGWGWLILKLFSSIFGLTLDAVDIIKNIPTEKEKKLQRKQKKLYFEKTPLVELDQEGLKYKYIDIKIKSKYTQENADELAKIKCIYRLKYKRPLICNDEMWYSKFNKCKTKHPENYRQKEITIMELFTSEERKYLEPFIEEYQKEKEQKQENRNKRLEEMKKEKKINAES